MTIDHTQMSWQAIDRVRQHYREKFGPASPNEHYRDWMYHEWGIAHGAYSITVADEQKYTMFLLRFA